MDNAELPEPDASQGRLLPTGPSILAGFFLGSIVLLALWWMGLTPWTGLDGDSIRSLAVLPLETFSDNSEEAYLAVGLTDALISQLAQIETLRVVPWSSVAGYQKQRKPISVVIRELNVDAVMEGTLVRSGDQVQIRARLIEGSSQELICRGPTIGG